MTASTGPKISSRAMRMSFVDVGEHRRLHVPAAVDARRAGRCRRPSRCAPSSWPSAMYFSTRSCWRLRDERTDLGRGVGRVADRQRRRPSPGPRRRPRRSGSRLARMRVCATHAWPLFMSDANFRPSTVAARSASSRMIAADLPPSSRLHALELLAADRRDAPAGRGRTGERDLVDAGVAHEVLADLAAGGQDRDDTLRDAGLVEQLGHQVRVERRLGRGLEDDRAARRAARARASTS